MAANSFNGLDGLLRQLSALDVKAQRIVGEETRKAAEVMAQDARALAPVVSGRLRDSIQVVRDAGGFYKVGTDVPYAAAKELGVRNSLAKPFLFPAYMLHRDEFLENLKSAMKTLL